MTTAVSDVEAEAAIRAIGAAVGKALEARCVLLFGSRARGDHKSHSDVDLAVILADSGTNLGPQRRIDLETRGATVAEQVSERRPVPEGGRQGLDGDRNYRSREALHQSRGGAYPGGKAGCCSAPIETLPGEEVVAELPHVQELIDMAQGQLRTTDLLGNPDIREEDFGFHAERVTELTLKAWVALTGNQYQLTHHLHQLFDQLDEAGIPDASQIPRTVEPDKLCSCLPVPENRVARDGPGARNRGCSGPGGTRGLFSRASRGTVISK